MMNSDSSSARRNPARVLLVSTLAFTLLFAVWLMLGVLSVPIKDELALSVVEFTWLTSIAVLSGSLLRLPVGLLTDLWGGRATMTAILLATAVPCYALSRAQTFGEAMLCALLFGLAGNGFAAGIAWNAAWFERERQGAALGTFGAGNVGASLTKLVGPQLIALVPATGWLNGWIPGGWRAIPVLYSVALVIMAAYVHFGSPLIDRKPGRGRSLSELTRPLSEMRVWRFGLYYVVVFGAYVALSLWLPSYYTGVYGLSLPSAALLTAFFIFPASLLRPVGGFLSDRYGGRLVTYAVFTGTLGISGVLCLPPTLLPVEAFFVCTLVLGVCMGIGKASVYKYVPEYYPRDVGLVGGLVGTLGALGGFLLPLSFGYLQAAFGRPEICFYVLTAIAAVSLTWLHWVVRSLTAAKSKGSERQALQSA